MQCTAMQCEPRPGYLSETHIKNTKLRLPGKPHVSGGESVLYKAQRQKVKGRNPYLWLSLSNLPDRVENA